MFVSFLNVDRDSDVQRLKYTFFVFLIFTTNGQTKQYKPVFCLQFQNCGPSALFFSDMAIGCNGLNEQVDFFKSNWFLIF